MVVKKVKTRKDILHHEAVRGCASCRSLSGKNNREEYGQGNVPSGSPKTIG